MNRKLYNLALSTVPTDTGLQMRCARVSQIDDTKRPYPSLPHGLSRRLREAFTGKGYASLDYAVGYLNGVACYLSKPEHHPIAKLMTLCKCVKSRGRSRRDPKTEDDLVALLRLVRVGLEGSPDDHAIPTRLLPPPTNRTRCGDFARGTLAAFLEDPVWSTTPGADDFLAPLRTLIRQSEQQSRKHHSGGLSSRRLATRQADELAPFMAFIFWEHRLHHRAAVKPEMRPDYSRSAA